MSFIEWLRIVIIGIVEGITEWLPISSTGHMILLDSLWTSSRPDIFTAEFWNMFLYVIQLGAILAVVTFFFHKLYPFSKRKNIEEKQQTWRLWFMVIVGCLPAAVLGILFDDKIEALMGGAIEFVIAAMLIIYGVLFIFVENRYAKSRPSITKLGQLDLKTVLIIGFSQTLAMIPGTSRSGVTIVAALLIGCSRYVAAEYTFFLAIPVMFGVSGLKIVQYIFKGPGFSGIQPLILIVGMLVAYAVSILVIRFLMSYIRKHDFKIFGYYRIILGVVIILYFTLKTIL